MSYVPLNKDVVESPSLVLFTPLVQFGADYIETIETIDKLDIKNPKMWML